MTTTKIHVKDFDFYYGAAKVLHGINLDVPERQVTALIGPSGCGKSTFIRSINRMNDVIPDAHGEGTIEVDGKNIYAAGTDVVRAQAQRAGADIVEVEGSHVIMISQPQAVTDHILKAYQAVAASAR